MIPHTNPIILHLKRNKKCQLLIVQNNVYKAVIKN